MNENKKQIVHKYYHVSDNLGCVIIFIVASICITLVFIFQIIYK